MLSLIRTDIHSSFIARPTRSLVQFQKKFFLEIGMFNRQKSFLIGMRRLVLESSRLQSYISVTKLHIQDTVLTIVGTFIICSEI